MKKLIAIILAMLCVFALCACSDTDNDTKTGDEGKTEVKPDYGELYYEANGVKFGILDEAEPVLDALGDPMDTFEADSCAYQGKDVFYYYDGFEILVNDIENTERITGITLTDDTVSNPQGVKIGMDMDEAIACMDGFEYVQAGDTYKFTVGSAMLRLSAGDDNTVAAAEYTVAANDE